MASMDFRALNKDGKDSFSSFIWNTFAPISLIDLGHTGSFYFNLGRRLVNLEKVVQYSTGAGVWEWVWRPRCLCVRAVKAPSCLWDCHNASPRVFNLSKKLNFLVNNQRLFSIHPWDFCFDKLCDWKSIQIFCIVNSRHILTL